MDWMSLLLLLKNNWKGIAAAVAVVVVLLMVYQKGSDDTELVYVAKIDQMEKDHAEELADRALAVAAALKDNEDLKRKLGETKRVHKKLVDDLTAELAGYRVLLPGCLQGAWTDGETTTTGGSVPGATGDGAFPETPQGALDRFTSRIKQDYAKAEAVMLSCHVVMEWAKANAPEALSSK